MKTSVQASVPTEKEAGLQLPQSMKLLVGAGGIYAAFLYYGTLQEDVFRYKAADGAMFKAAWFLQFLEALANVIIGGVGMQLAGPTLGLPKKVFAAAGASQVCAKAFTSLALAQGVSFPVVTLAKSGKMVPVMIGSLLLGGATYTMREYASVAAIIAGTCIVSMGKKKSAAASSTMGLAFIAMSLICDGLTGGLQKRLKVQSKEMGLKPKPYDLMFWTNFFMAITAAIVALFMGEITTGFSYCLANPVIMNKIVKFAVCSAVGQSFIFYTIANFDPLVCTTVTTTRKVFSVLLSIFLNGHAMSAQGWGGIALASGGILAELQDKAGGHGPKKEDAPKKA
ncbi:UAA transporter [Ochromonadaceae sp. CCMP2298]|nr:UAA transporter [Ochromonadaceae sp. CCMP2298]